MNKRQTEKQNKRIAEAAAILGALGGASRSAAKAAASRANGKKGGRPRKDGKPGAKIDPVTEASIRKMEGLLHKKELIRKGNAGVNANGQIVDIREESGAVPVPPHKTAKKAVDRARSVWPGRSRCSGKLSRNA